MDLREKPWKRCVREIGMVLFDDLKREMETRVLEREGRERCCCRE